MAVSDLMSLCRRAQLSDGRCDVALRDLGS